MHHESNDHGIAGTIALTGSIAGAVGLVGAADTQAMRPSTGAIVGRLHPREVGSLPPYVILGNSLHQGPKRAVGKGGGSLGSTYDPLRVDYEPGVGLKLPEVELPEGVSAERLGTCWGLLRGIEHARGPGPDRIPGRCPGLICSCPCGATDQDAGIVATVSNFVRIQVH